MQQAESSRDMVHRPKNSCLRDVYVFFLWHTSRHQLIAVIGGRRWSRADNLQPGTVEAGRVMSCAQEQLTWNVKCETIPAQPTVHQNFSKNSHTNNVCPPLIKIYNRNQMHQTFTRHLQ